MIKFMQKVINILIILAVAILFSCDEKDIPTVPNGKITIKSTLPEEIISFDTVSIIGEYFGYKENGKIILPDSSVIKGENCLLWQLNLIKFIMPKNIPSGHIFIIADKDTSNSDSVSISLLPKIDTVRIESGSFLMGSLASYDESPVHQVEISSSFFIAKYEVSQRLYETVMDKNPSKAKDWQLPVDSISWLDAVKFCNKLSILQGLDSCYSITESSVTWLKDKNGWRLPTEAEWEYACRAGTTGNFSGTGDINEMGWYNANSGYKSHPRGYKKPNQFDIYDMHGNLWEWCWDFYSYNYYSSSPQIDPKGPTAGERRVLRGGSFSAGQNYARSSNRELPDDLFTNIGIRIVKNDK